MSWSHISQHDILNLRLLLEALDNRIRETLEILDQEDPREATIFLSVSQAMIHVCGVVGRMTEALEAGATCTGHVDYNVDLEIPKTVREPLKSSFMPGCHEEVEAESLSILNLHLKLLMGLARLIVLINKAPMKD